MPNRLFFLFVLLTAGFGTLSQGYAQSPLDGYKYIIVPKKFDFLEEENQYRINSQTKYLFDKNGYTTLLKGADYPEDLMKNPCLGAEAKVIDESNSFTTKVRIAVSNCLGQVVFTSEEGRSKEKTYPKTYSLALNSAFESVAALGYEYNPDLAIVPGAVASAETVQEEEAETVEAEPVAVQAELAVATEPATEAAQAEPAVESEPAAAAAVVAAPAATASSGSEKSGAVTYGNENIAFFLIDQGDKLSAYVVRSSNENYAQGEMIGTFEKSSLPNVYRVEWKDMDKDIEQTTGYFDEDGNLKIDVKRDGKVEVLTFVKE